MTIFGSKHRPGLSFAYPEHMHGHPKMQRQKKYRSEMNLPDALLVY
jgi:hypothetical protein